MAARGIVFGSLLLLGGCRFDTGGLTPAANVAELGPRDRAVGDPSSIEARPADRPAEGQQQDRPAPDVAPTCSDGVQNGGESDVDCGGPCPAKCKTGKGCKKHVECESGICGPASTCRPCAGTPLDGYCWYRGAQAQSCDQACAAHGGCDLAGTLGYAGSGGSDAQCLKVLGLFTLGSTPLDQLPHQSWSNNALGCQLCFPTKPTTYWSAPPLGLATSCDSFGPFPSLCERMCACNE
jgi:hypothetical protein